MEGVESPEIPPEGVNLASGAIAALWPPYDTHLGCGGELIPFWMSGPDTERRTDKRVQRGEWVHQCQKCGRKGIAI